jgi:hypothetical protein
MNSFNFKMLAATLAVAAVSTMTNSVALAGGDYGVGNGSDGLDLSITKLASVRSQHQFSAPVSIPSKYEISHSDMLKLWQESSPTSKESLKGLWKEVAETASQNCECTNIKMEYDASGIKNHDGSVRMLRFKEILKPSNPFGRTQNGLVLSVELFNLGRSGEKVPDTNQGPYEVDSREPQFAQWGYNSNFDGLDKSAYFEYSCRLLRKDSNHLICALSAKIIDPKRYTPQFNACGKEANGIFLGFEKVPQKNNQPQSK